MFVTPLVLLLARAAPDTLPAAPAADAPVVVIHRQPALPLVGLRLAILADDPPGYAGAGHLFQHLLLPSLRDQARRVGGRVTVSRSADAVAYTIIGPAAELPYLSSVLRQALAPPAAGATELLGALRELGEERAAEREIAAEYLRAAIRAQLFPAQLPAAGTDAAARRLETARLADVWAAMYRPDQVVLTAVGDVDAENVARSFSAPAAPAGEPLEVAVDSVQGFGGARPEATRAWVGVGHPLTEASPAAAAVAAWLYGDALRARLAAGDARAEHWWTRDGQAVVVVLAVPPAGVAAARTLPAATLSALATTVDDAAVRRAAAALRREMLFFGRTPERMADLLGEFVDRTGDRAAAQTFFDALAQLRADDVRAVLTLMREAKPATAEALPPPQKKTP